MKSLQVFFLYHLFYIFCNHQISLLGICILCAVHARTDTAKVNCSQVRAFVHAIENEKQQRRWNGNVELMSSTEEWHCWDCTWVRGLWNAAKVSLQHLISIRWLNIMQPKAIEIIPSSRTICCCIDCGNQSDVSTFALFDGILVGVY